jgi:hypothetical protein
VRFIEASNGKPFISLHMSDDVKTAVKQRVDAHPGNTNFRASLGAREH